MTLTLPAELFDSIIGFIDDQHSLMACSLVARDWVHCSRFYLFRSIHLLPQSLPTFIKLLHDQHSTIKYAVERIRFTGIALSPKDSKIKWISDGFTELALLLPKFSCLHLGYLNYRGLTEPIIPGFNFKSAPLTQLRLFQIKFASFMQFSNLILAFPTLEDVFLRSVTWSEPLRVYHRASVLPMRLQSLTLKACCKKDVVNWLLSQNPIPLIPYLDFSSIHDVDVPIVSQYLRIVGPILTDLTIGFNSLEPARGAELFMASLDLSLNTGLRSLCIENFIHRSRLSHPSSISPWILQLVRRLNVPGLETIQFGVYLGNPSDLHPDEGPIDWSAWDHILTSSSVWKLRSIHFKITPVIPVAFEEVVQEIDKSLPKCCEAAIPRHVSFPMPQTRDRSFRLRY